MCLGAARVSRPGPRGPPGAAKICLMRSIHSFISYGVSEHKQEAPGGANMLNCLTPVLLNLIQPRQQEI